MDLRRLRAGEWITGLAGVVLVVSLFLPWYDGANAWEALTIIDVLLALVGLAAIGLVPLTARETVPAIPLAIEALLAIAAKVAVVLVLLRVISPAGDADVREAGLWLALASSVMIAAGSWIAMRDERLSEGDRLTDLTGRPVSSAPEIETLPAPRPDASAS